MRMFNIIPSRLYFSAEPADAQFASAVCFRIHLASNPGNPGTTWSQHPDGTVLSPAAPIMSRKYDSRLISPLSLPLYKLTVYLFEQPSAIPRSIC
jgi:hypothetical protein